MSLRSAQACHVAPVLECASRPVLPVASLSLVAMTVDRDGTSASGDRYTDAFISSNIPRFPESVASRANAHMVLTPFAALETAKETDSRCWIGFSSSDGSAVQFP